MHCRWSCFVIHSDAPEALAGLNPAIYGLAHCLAAFLKVSRRRMTWVSRLMQRIELNGSLLTAQAHAKYGNQWALIAKLPGLEGR